MKITPALIEQLSITMNGKNISEYIQKLELEIESAGLVFVRLDIKAMASEIDDIAPFSSCINRSGIKLPNIEITFEHPFFNGTFKGWGDLHHRLTYNGGVSEFRLYFNPEEVMTGGTTKVETHTG